MTVAIPEITDAAESRIAKRRAARTVHGRVESSAYDTYNTRTRARPGPAAAAPSASRSTSRGGGAARAAGSYVRDSSIARQYGRQAGYVGSRAQLVPGNRNYQGIILGEYLAAVALIALSPIASGGSATAQAKSSPSPYATNDLRQLVATSGVYFILALVSSGSHGRFAAWFGGLILLATLISKTGQSQLASLVAVISQQPGGAGSTSTGGGGATLA